MFRLFPIFLVFLPGCTKEKPSTVMVAPSLLVATKVSSSEIILAWTDNSNNEDGFKIERKTATGNFTEVASVGSNINTYSDKGLSPDNEYTYRIFSFNATGRSVTYSNEEGADTYIGKIPYAETVYANQILGKSALLTAIVNANSSRTLIIFEYGITNAYGQFAFMDGSYLEGFINFNVSAHIVGLKGNSTYHFRVSAENSFGRTYGEDKTFNTLGGLPIAYSNDATLVMDSSAVMNARVFPNYLDTQIGFEFGTSTVYGSTVIPGIPNPVYASRDTSQIMSTIKGLLPNTEYHYRIRAENEVGIVYGEDKIFRTKN
jgi:hypothetical protein